VVLGLEVVLGSGVALDEGLEVVLGSGVALDEGLETGEGSGVEMGSTMVMETAEDGCGDAEESVDRSELWAVAGGERVAVANTPAVAALANTPAVAAAGETGAEGSESVCLLVDFG
jgi:hypothetical protein